MDTLTHSDQGSFSVNLVKSEHKNPELVQNQYLCKLLSNLLCRNLVRPLIKKFPVYRQKPFKIQ